MLCQHAFLTEIWRQVKSSKTFESTARKRLLESVSKSGTNFIQRQEPLFRIETPGGLILMMSYTGRFCLKRVSSFLRVMERYRFHESKYMKGQGNLSFRYLKRLLITRINTSYGCGNDKESSCPPDLFTLKIGIRYSSYMQIFLNLFTGYVIDQLKYMFASSLQITTSTGFPRNRQKRPSPSWLPRVSRGLSFTAALLCLPSSAIHSLQQCFLRTQDYDACARACYLSTQQLLTCSWARLLSQCTWCFNGLKANQRNPQVST